MDHNTVILVILCAIVYKVVESRVVNSTTSNSVSLMESGVINLLNVGDGGLREDEKRNLMGLIENHDDAISHDRLQSDDNWKLDVLKAVGKFVTSSDIFEEMLGSENTNSTSQCVQDIRRLIVSAFAVEKWTLPFLDASGKPVPALTKGWLNLVGNYDQCKESKSSLLQSEGRHVFKGEYCVLTISTLHPYVIPTIGLCLPDSCSELEISLLATKVIGRFVKNITVESVECRNAETKVTVATILAITILSLFGILITLGTVYDLLYVQRCQMFKREEPVRSSINSAGAYSIDSTSMSKSYGTILGKRDVSEPGSETISLQHKLLVCFSVYTNGKNLLDVSQTSESLGSIHGIRYLSICSILLGHLYLEGFDYSINKLPRTLTHLDRWTFCFVVTSSLAVDTFFVMSGLLVSYQTIKDMAKCGWRIHWSRFYYHRVWRLTPPYMIVIVIFLGLTQYVGEGPLWRNTQPQDKEYCEDDWWKNLLYINNFGRLSTMCMKHSWYLANNMQFYVLSPLMLIPLYLHRVAGIVTCLVFLLASWITTGVLSNVNDWVTTPIFTEASPKIRNEWDDDCYIKPWCRIGPFVIGLLAGYLLTHIKGKSLQIKWWVVALGWIVSTGTALSIIYGLHGDISGDHPSSTEVAAVYNSISRSVWGAAVCWIVIACDAGYGGPVNTFLSWSPFVVLGRLTYMAYLIHPYILHIFFENMGYLYYTNDTTMAIYFVGLLGFSTFAASFFMLAFESPFVALEKRFLARKTKE